MNYVFPAELCQNSDLSAEFASLHALISVPTIHLSQHLYHNSGQNFVFTAELCQNSDFLGELSFITCTYPVIQNKILVRILFFRQNLVRILNYSIIVFHHMHIIPASKSKFSLEFFSSRIKQIFRQNSDYSRICGSLYIGIIIFEKEFCYEYSLLKMNFIRIVSLTEFCERR